MDILSGISSVGNFINERDERKHTKTHTNRIKRTQINGDNLYNSWNVRNKRRHEKSISNHRFKNSRNPDETGIVPSLYNQMKASEKRKLRRRHSIEAFDNDSVFSDDNSLLSGYNSAPSVAPSKDSIRQDHMALFKRSNLLSDNRVHERKFMRHTKDRNKPGFFSQFEDLAFDNPGDPVSSNNIHHQTGRYANISRLEMERDIALKGEFGKFNKDEDMTYGVVDEKDFVHNNMVPFFKSGFGKGYGPDSIMQKKLDDVKQRKLERFTGSVKNIEYRPKTERRPLFNPHIGLTHIYGMPNFTDYFESRFIPGRERRNERLHQPVRVTPGLNLGYNEIAKHGFQDTYRALPKTVDELRTANNPKISYGNVVIPGMKSVRRPIIPNVAKHRPVRFKENDPRDFVKSLTYYRAPTIYGNFNAPSTNRQMTTRAWYSAANTSPTYHKPGSLYPKHKISHKENFLYPAPRNTTGVEREKPTTAVANTYYLHPTNRQLTENKTYQGPLGLHDGQKGGYHAQQGGTIAQPTLRQNTQIKTHYNPVGLHEGQKGGYHAEQDGTIAQPTLRQNTQNKTYYNPVGLHEGQKGGYHAAQGGTIAQPTLRQNTQNKTYYNPVGLHEGQRGGYQAALGGTIAQPTLRQNTQNNTYYNPVGLHEGQRGGYQVAQAGTIAQPTLRQNTQNKTYYNPAGLHEGQRGGYQAAQAGTIAPTTLRQTTQNKTYYNPVGLHEGQIGGYQAAQAGTIAPTTLRQATQNKTHYNPVGLHEGQKGGYQAAQAGTIAPATLRQATQNKTYYNPVGLHEGQKGGYQVAQAGTIAPATLRQATQNKTHYNPVGLHEGQKGGYQAAQAGTIAPPTLRQNTQNKTYYNPVAHHEGQKGGYHAEQAGTIAPATLRQATQDKTYQGPLGLHEGQKGGYHAQQAGTIAPATLRQLTQDKTYQGPLTLHEGQKTRRRADANNSLVNIQKEATMIVRDGGAPTTSNYEKGPTYEGTMVQLCEPIQINRELYGKMVGQRPLQCVPTMHTRVANVLPQISAWRFDRCVVKNLATNPFISNTQHKSVNY